MMNSRMAVAIAAVALTAAGQAASRQIPLVNLPTGLPPGTAQAVTAQLQDAEGAVLFAEAHPSIVVDDQGRISFLFGSLTADGLDPADFPSGASRFLEVVDGLGASVLSRGRLRLQPGSGPVLSLVNLYCAYPEIENLAGHCGCREEDQDCSSPDCRIAACGVRGCGGCCGIGGVPISEDGCGVCCNEATSHTCGYGAICCGEGGCCPEETPVCCQPPDSTFPAFCCLEDQRCDVQERRCVPR